MDQVAAASGLTKAWAATRPLVEQLLAADVSLIGTPRYNFSIPAALKAVEALAARAPVKAPAD